MIELVQIDRVRPSTYNPRKADPRRLDILELSLRKLGFVLPLFADANGELLSGHQRQHVAERMGLDQVPVCFVDGMDLAQRKAINILFNRATNDMSFGDTPKNLTEALARVDLAGLADRVPDAQEMYPCLRAEEVPVDSLTEQNIGRWDRYARNAARALRSKKLVMPIVCTPDGVVVNGNIARAFADVIDARGIDFVSIEAAKEMARTFKAPGRLIVADACDVPTDGADLVVAFLTLIFIPPARRGALIERIKGSLRPGGAFIAVERMVPEGGYPSLGMARLTLAQKIRAGATPAAVIDKELSLVGIQRPMPRAAFNGFREWFRLGDFSGWLYESGE